MIGKTIWVFNYDIRFYEPGSNSPVWRRHWCSHPVVGETSRSWVLSTGKKVPKTGADPARFAFSEAEIDRAEWVHNNVYKIEREVGRTRDYEKLTAIANVLGYKEVLK